MEIVPIAIGRRPRKNVTYKVIWEFLKESFSDLKETVIEAIKSMLITQVIEAGIKWVLSLLIPGAGFIKAIMAIKDIIVFFVESAIMLIPAITEAILALAAGSIAGVGKAIEFGLASLLLRGGEIAAVGDWIVCETYRTRRFEQTRHENLQENPQAR